MTPRSIRSMHAQQLYQLTGCKYAVLMELTRRLTQQLKSFKILRNLFPLQPKRYATCFKAVALVYNMNLQEKNSQK